MKLLTEVQIQKLSHLLSKHLAFSTPESAVDYPINTVQSLLDPAALATKSGMMALSAALYRTCGLTITRAVA